MNYKEATYTEKQAFEKTLTIGQRAKMRRLEKQFKDQIQPIMWASHAKEEELRQEAWKTLNCEQRIEELETEYAPRLQELRDQIEALQEQFSKLQNESYDKRSDIRTEPYMVAGNDPEVKAMNAIWRKTREVQEAKFQQLIDTFTEEAK
jgi:phage host-nuclease inhibitor protein Gam